MLELLHGEMFVVMQCTNDCVVPVNSSAMQCIQMTVLYPLIPVPCINTCEL